MEYENSQPDLDPIALWKCTNCGRITNEDDLGAEPYECPNGHGQVMTSDLDTEITGDLYEPTF